MIIIEESSTRNAVFNSDVPKEVLLEDIIKHKEDIFKGINFFKEMLDKASMNHDHDKITDLGQFYSDFIGDFKSTVWWDNHRKVNRHHLTHYDGVPEDVNLIDVLEMVVDCVMAGRARNGFVYDVTIPPDVLKRALDNTVEILINNVEVRQD